MTQGKKNEGDAFGLAAYGEALNTIAKGAVDGASAFLSRICLPAAEEFGLLLRDKVSAWRMKNAVNIALRAERMLGKCERTERLQAHPRLVSNIVHHGSWTDDADVQQMWSGLLASSCSEDGRDETNLIFVHLLSQLTSCQARILRKACEQCDKVVTEAGWISAERLEINLQELIALTGVSDIHRLDRELDYLRALGLIGGPYSGGFSVDSDYADITPNGLALQMYARCQGYTRSPVVFFGLQQAEEGA